MSRSVTPVDNWTDPGPAIEGYMNLRGLSQQMFRDFDEMLDLEGRASRGEKLKLTQGQKLRMVRTVRSATNIYFVFAPQHNLIKIGQAIDINKRLSTLRSGSPAQLKLLAHVRFFGDLEGFLHAQLKEHQSHGEWFHAEDRVLSIVEAAIDDGVSGIMRVLNIDIASLPA